jgi:hypothetical protein
MVAGASAGVPGTGALGTVAALAMPAARVSAASRARRQGCARDA